MGPVLVCLFVKHGFRYGMMNSNNKGTEVFGYRYSQKRKENIILKKANKLFLDLTILFPTGIEIPGIPDQIKFQFQVIKCGKDSGSSFVLQP